MLADMRCQFIVINKSFKAFTASKRLRYRFDVSLLVFLQFFFARQLFMTDITFEVMVKSEMIDEGGFILVCFVADEAGV